jgi:ATP-binding cassette subfamily G (WHITE) protein 2
MLDFFISGTIIFSIHQPRYSIFKLFDTVMLMCKGKCVYQDSARHVVPHFVNYGYPCEPHDNPADYALDVLIDVSQKPETLTVWNDIYNIKYENTRRSLHSFDSWNTIKTLDLNRRKFTIESARSVRTELFYLSQRAIRNAIRNPALALSQIVVSVIIGLLVGSLFYNLEKTVEPGVQNRLGAIFFIVISQVFSTVTAIESLVNERVLFIHVSIFNKYK